MCGIVYIEDFNGNPVNNAVMQQFDQQRHRGTEGFGIFDGKEKHMVHASKEKKILKWLVKYDSPLLLMHHRFPTSTINVKRAAHPFSTKTYFGKTQYILVHNGSIRNDEELYTEHYDMGIRYHSLLQDGTFNDSEALLWDLALTLEGKQAKLKAYGGIAFICLKLEKGKLTKMYFGRNTSPLNLSRDKNGISLSSEGEGEPIDSHVLHTWNYKLRRLTKKPMDIESFEPYTPSTRGSWWNNAPYTGPYVSDRLNKKYGSRSYPGYHDDAWGDYNDDHVIEYEPDPKTQMYLPVGLTEEEEDLQLAGHRIPTMAEAELNAMAYLARYRGHYDTAYWMLEQEYADLEDESYTIDNIQKRVMINKTIEYLNSCDDYIDEKSVSKIWEDICQTSPQ